VHAVVAVSHEPPLARHVPDMHERPGRQTNPRQHGSPSERPQPGSSQLDALQKSRQRLPQLPQLRLSSLVSTQVSPQQLSAPLHIPPAQLLRVGDVAAGNEDLGPAGDAVFESEVNRGIGRIVAMAFETGGVITLPIHLAVLDHADVATELAPPVGE